MFIFFLFRFCIQFDRKLIISSTKGGKFTRNQQTAICIYFAYGLIFEIVHNGSVCVPVDDEGYETFAAEIKEVLAEMAQVFSSVILLYFFILS